MPNAKGKIVTKECESVAKGYPATFLKYIISKICVVNFFLKISMDNEDGSILLMKILINVGNIFFTFKHYSRCY